MRYICILPNTAEITSTDNPSCWQECGDTSTLTADDAESIVTVLGEFFLFVLQFLLILRIISDPVFQLESLYSMKIHAHVHKKTCTKMFTEVLFIIAKTRNDPISINSRMNK